MKTRIISYCFLSMLLGPVCMAKAADSNVQNVIYEESLPQDVLARVGYITAVAINHLGEVVRSDGFTLLTDGRFYYIDAGRYSLPIKVINSSVRGYKYTFYARGHWWYFN